MSDRRMDAYYYGFDETNVDEIDKVLSAVAWAGKYYHNTEDWTYTTGQHADHTGNSPVDWIQNAAKEAAAEITRLRAELATARLEGMEEAASEAQARAKFWMSGNNKEAKIRHDEARKIAAAIRAAAKEGKP